MRAIRERISQSASSGTVKMLDSALPMRKKRSHESMESSSYSNIPQASGWKSSNQPFPSTSANPTPKGLVKEKLHQLAIDKKRKAEEQQGARPVSKPAPVVVAKVTKKSRSDMFLQDFTSNLQPEPVAPRKLPPPNPGRPKPRSDEPNPPPPVMPVDSIISAINNNRLSQVIEKPNRPPIQQQVELPESSKRQTNFVPPSPALQIGSSSSTRPRHTEEAVRLAANLGQPPVFIRGAQGQAVIQVRPTPRPAEALPQPRCPPTFQRVPQQAPLHRAAADSTRYKILTKNSPINI